MASHEVNQLVAHLHDLRYILLDMKNDIHSLPRIELPDGPDVKVWAYSSILPVSPTVIEDFLIVILFIPLIDKSLQIDLYSIHNIPALHCEAKSSLLMYWKANT